MNRFKKLAIALLLVAGACIAGLALFGKNIRTMFAVSASSLASEPYARSHGQKRSAKTLGNFGTSHDSREQRWSSERLAEPLAQDVRHEEPTLPPNPWTDVSRDALSTFAADVDTASYTFARKQLLNGVLPQPANVRVEEFVNYFRYDYPAPADGAFAVHTDLVASPFQSNRHLLRVGVQGKRVARRDRKPVHLTFLVDTSCSMAAEDKLPLAKQSLSILTRNLREDDSVALITYAGSTEEILPATPATFREHILRAIDSLRVGGGTAMGSGMELAYRNAVRELRPGEISRVIVLSDGDANIGRTSHQEILRAVEGYVKEGVTLSTIGFGMGNYRDHLMEQLANKGNGNSFYIDSERQARRVFEEQLTGTLEVIAKDLKLQVEFEPRAVRRYRLVGYENRAIADRDFRNDKVDAGEVGAGHTVTALYELELTGETVEQLATVRIRAKQPNGETATESAFPVSRERLHKWVDEAPQSFRLALAAAGFAEVLRGNSDVSHEELAELVASLDDSEDVRELRQLIDAAARLQSRRADSSWR